MRILLDQAVYDQRNKGNVALLQTAIDRFMKLWPDASIYVLTEAPYSLRLYCPTVHPVSVHPWNNWSQAHNRVETLLRMVPRPVLQFLLELREDLWHRFPSLQSGEFRRRIKALLNPSPINHVENSDADLVSTMSIRKENQNEEANQDFIQALQNADLVVATGGGYLCDADKQYSLQVFDTLEMAVNRGKPAGMVGIGVGPLHDQELRGRLGRFLPSLDLILIREPKIAGPLLASLGVAPERVIMTGDDAIEMAYEARPSGWGNFIGVNLRLARYTEVEQNHIEKVRLAIHQAAGRYRSTLMGLPTSYNIKEADLEVIRKILKGYDKVSLNWRRFDSPSNMIKCIGRCRLVVTGSYHPAVFALAQGIPAIGLVKSRAYIDKFSALQDEFGPACQKINFED